MDEYMYYQMQNDPSLHQRMVVASHLSPQVNYVHVPYPHPEKYDSRYIPNMPPPGYNPERPRGPIQ